jgi:hypothetical protein
MTTARGENWSGKVEDVPHCRGTKGIDRLGVVADHGEPCAIGCQREKDRGLQSVGVLILVNQDVIEIRPHLRGDRGHLNGLAPIQQQIVVIEHVVALLGGDVSGEEALQAKRLFN